MCSDEQRKPLRERQMSRSCQQCSQCVQRPRAKPLIMLRRTLISLLASGVLAGPAMAQIPRSQWAPEDQRGERGREVPFSQIQRELKQDYGGQLLDVSKDGGRYVVSWIDGNGRRLVVEVDAQSGRTISVRGR